MPAYGPSHLPPSSPERLRVAILADDLSGAADSAVAFAARGLAARVTLGAFVASGTEVLAVDLDSRRQECGEAASRVRSGWRLAGAHGAATTFRKIDSKLRGHVMAELLALAGCVDPHAVIVVCPAHPAAGVRYRDGRPWGEDGLASRLPGTTDFAALAQGWQAAGLRIAPAGSAMTAAALERCLMQVDGDGSGPRLALVDAEDERDLDTVAHLALASMSPAVLVGSGGLAAALARREAGPVRRTPRPAAVPAPVRQAIVIAGSNAALTRRQLEHLGRAGLGQVHWQAPGHTRLADPCVGDFPAGQLAAVALGGPQGVRPEGSGGILAAFVAACLPLAARADGLVLTGGETARAILDGLGVQALEIEAELAPGVVVSRAVGAWSGTVITKSGSFGEPDALERALRLLREGATVSRAPGAATQEIHDA